MGFRALPAGVAAALLVVAGLAGAEDTEPDRQAILVELFTSQGCSSCPAADRLVAKLAAQPPGGIEVVALSFHVDYWNHIGWTDPFSNPAWSARQRDRAARFGLSSIYTPQVVVQGTHEMVGSDEREIVRALRNVAARSAAGSISIAGVEPTGGPALTVELSATLDPGAPPATLLLAIHESGLRTPVGSGENASRVLRNERVVRRLDRVMTLTPGTSRTTRFDAPLEAAWRRDGLGVAAFLETADGAVLAAASAQL